MLSEKRVYGKTEHDFVRSGVNEYGLTEEEARKRFHNQVAGYDKKPLSEDEKKRGGSPLFNGNLKQVGLLWLSKDNGVCAVQMKDETFYTLGD